MRHWMLGLLFVGLSFAHEARADLPGPRPTCETEGLTCETCWEHYGADEQEKAAFESCAAPLREKGLTEGCRHRQGAGDQVFFCANGAKPPIVTRGPGGGGCGGCAVGADGDGPTLAMVLAGLAVAGAARRRRAR